jgi:hypothetical protein
MQEMICMSDFMIKCLFIDIFSDNLSKFLILSLRNNNSLKIFTEKMKIIDFKNSDFLKLLRPPHKSNSQN